jgi:hypothetical protein
MILEGAIDLNTHESKLLPFKVLFNLHPQFCSPFWNHFQSFCPTSHFPFASRRSFWKTMLLLRRLRSPFLPIAFLIVLAVITVVSVGEGFKVLAIRRDGITLRKRDGFTIAFDLPWK